MTQKHFKSFVKTSPDWGLEIRKGRRSWTEQVKEFSFILNQKNVFCFPKLLWIWIKSEEEKSSPQLASRRKKLEETLDGSVHQVPSRHWSSAPSLLHRLFKDTSRLLPASEFSLWEKKTTLSLVCQVAFLRLGVSTGRSKPQHVQSWALKKKKEKHGIYWKQISHFQTICHGLDGLNPLNNIKQVPALDAKKSSLACCDAAQTCVTMKEGWMISYAWWKSKEKRIRAPV